MSNSSPRVIASCVIGSTDHRANRIWIAPAARMATPVTAARMSNIRVLMRPSKHATATHSVPSPRRYHRYALRRSTPSRGQRPRKRTHEHVPARTTHDRGGSQAPGPRGHLRSRSGSHHLGCHRVRVSDPRVPRSLQDRLRRVERALDPPVHRRARVLPSARAGGRARGRAPTRQRSGWRPRHQEGRVGERGAHRRAGRLHAPVGARVPTRGAPVPRADRAVRLLPHRARNLRRAVPREGGVLRQRALRSLRRDPRQRGHHPDDPARRARCARGRQPALVRARARSAADHRRR